MDESVTHPILARQYMLICLFFLFIASTQRGCTCNPHEVVKRAFNWYLFEESLDKHLFHNIHRMDKDSFHILVRDIMPNLSKKYKRPDKLRLSYAHQVSITLSYLGGARICDLRVFHRPIKKKVIFSYIWNVIDAINETCKFSFPVDHTSLLEIERGFRSKSRRKWKWSGAPGPIVPGP